MKKRYAAFIIGMVVISFSLFAAEMFDGNMEVPIQDVYDNYCIQPRCCENSKSNFFVRADLLYWKPQVSGIELGFGTSSIDQETIDGVVVTTTLEYDTEPYFYWDPGYRIAAGYRFDCSNWEIGAVWTDFHGKGSRRTDDPSSTLNTGMWRVKLLQLDTIFAYNAWSHCSFHAKPFFGIRWANILQKLNVNLLTEITLEGVPAAEVRFLNEDENFHGFGPLFGCNLDWDIGCGFGIYANAGASILYGNYNVNFYDSDTFSAPILQDFISINRRHLDAFDFNIDIAFGFSWHTRFSYLSEVTMKLGFEHHDYFDQCHMSATVGDLSFDGAVLSLELAL